jgi:hypothetical protein
MPAKTPTILTRNGLQYYYSFLRTPEFIGSRSDYLGFAPQPLIYFDRPVDLDDKPQAGEEPNGPGDEEEGE